MIGGITKTVAVSDINDPEGIVNTIYKYGSGTYQSASEIDPAEGYWIHAEQKGNIELSAGETSKSRPSQITQAVNQLTFSSGNASQKFFVAKQQLDQSERKHFLMPPQPPQTVLDVRTSDDYRLAEGQSSELELTTNSYPVKVLVSQDVASTFVLKGITGTDTVYYHLAAEQEAKIRRPHQKLLLQKGSAGELITEHNLLPNYPNPFNPSTRIRYQVASQADVLVEVYDVIGRKVQTLVDRQQLRGSYAVQFDGSNLSSGLYFIHLKAGNTAKTQKMTLVK